MAKHTTEESRVKSLLDTLTSSSENSVVEIDRSRFVHFKAREKVVEKLQLLLGSSAKFATTLWRAVKGYDAEEVSLTSSSYSGLKDSGIHHLLSKSATTLLGNIITPEGVRDLGLQDFRETDYYISSSVTESRSRPAAGRVQSGAELIRLALNNPGLIKAILNTKKAPITREEDLSELEDSSVVLDGNILAIKRVDNIVTSKFNSAAFIQTMQKYCHFSESSPVIAKLMTAENTYTINLDHLQFFIGSKISPLIFKPVGSGSETMLEPIALHSANSSKSVAKSKTLFNIAVDISGSMEASLKLCKEKLGITLGQIVNTVEDWTMVITTFNDKYVDKTFHSTGDKVRDLFHLDSYIKTFSAGGNTKLFGTMYDQLRTLGGEYTHYASIIFTDGGDNCGGVSERDVIDVARSAKGRLGNFQIFTLELGTDNLRFFTTLASETGCTHIKLDSMSDMSEFGQYTAYLGRNSKVVQFLLDSNELYKMTVAEGQMIIGHKGLSPSTKVVIGKTAYDIQSPTSSFDAPFSYPDSVVNKLIGSIDGLFF